MKKPVIANLERLNRFLDDSKLDAVVARSGTNFTYLAGFAYPGTLARHLDLPDSPRGIYLIWPRKGEPAIVLNAIAEGLTRRDSWVKRIEVYAGYAEPPVQKLIATLKDMGLGEARVGFEKGYVSAKDWNEISGRLPKMAMSDCTQMMDEVRWIKTAGEIALLKRGTDPIRRRCRHLVEGIDARIPPVRIIHRPGIVRKRRRAGISRRDPIRQLSSSRLAREFSGIYLAECLPVSKEKIRVAPLDHSAIWKSHLSQLSCLVRAVFERVRDPEIGDVYASQQVHGGELGIGRVR